MASPPALSFRRPHRRGFSLVEVTLALGLCVFALTAVFALMPIGLTTFRSSIETSLRADLTRKIASDLRQTPFAEIVTANMAEYYFTDDGAPASGPDDSFYKVTCSVSSDAEILKDENGAPYNSSSLKRIEVSYFTFRDQVRKGSDHAIPSFKDYIYIANRGI